MFKITTLFSLFLIFFLLLYFFPWQNIQATYWAKEMVNFSHKQMKEEEGTRIAAVKAFNVAEKKIQELTTKLNKAGREKKSAEESGYEESKSSENILPHKSLGIHVPNIR